MIIYFSLCVLLCGLSNMGCEQVVKGSKGSCSIVVQRLPGIREVPGSNPLGGNILCSPSPSEETINRGPNTPIPTMHALICE